MAEISAISWTDSTWNPWVGCAEAGPACDFCYARAWAERAGRPQLWKGSREKTKTWGEVLKWKKNNAAWLVEHGRKRRIFTASLADFFDNAVPEQWRGEAWALIQNTRHEFEWYIVTKRWPNIETMLPSQFDHEHFGHVVLISTTVTQAEYDRDRPRHERLRAQHPWLRTGLSVEPMLGPIDLGKNPPVDWAIIGGESGAHAREMQPEWAMSLIQQCKDNKVPIHFKQAGSNHAMWGPDITGAGKDPKQWPKEFWVREFPREN